MGGMMLHVGVLTFTKFHQMKCTHRADMEDMVSSSYYDPNADVFGVLERAIDKQHKVATTTQRRKTVETKRQEAKKKSSEENIQSRADEMLQRGWDPNRPEDHSMAKLGRILDQRGTLKSQSLQTPPVRKVQDKSRESDRVDSTQPPREGPDPVELLRQAKEQEEKEAADRAQRAKEAKEAAEKARKEQEAKEAEEKKQREKEAKEAAEKARKEQEAKEAAEKAKKEKEAKEAAEKAKKEQEAKEAAEKAKKAKEAAEKAKR